MGQLVMSPIFKCLCIIAGITAFEAHNALEWAVHNDYIREDGFVVAKYSHLCRRLSENFNTLLRTDCKIIYEGKNHPKVIDENGNTVFDPFANNVDVEQQQ